MIRFIDLGKQCCPGEVRIDKWSREFAFYNTNTDAFVNIYGDETWDCWKDFEECVRLAGLSGDDSYRSLCPPWVFEAPPLGGNFDARGITDHTPITDTLRIAGLLKILGSLSSAHKREVDEVLEGVIAPLLERKL